MSHTLREVECVFLFGFFFFIPHMHSAGGSRLTVTSATVKCTSYRSIWENNPTPNLIYYLSKYFPNEFKVLGLSSSYNSTDINFVNHGPF